MEQSEERRPMGCGSRSGRVIFCKVGGFVFRFCLIKDVWFLFFGVEFFYSFVHPVPRLLS